MSTRPSNEAYLERCLGQEARLSIDAAFQEVLGGRAEDNASMGYLSDQAFEVMAYYVEQALEKELVNEEESRPVAEELLGLLKAHYRGPAGYALQLTADGFLSTGRSRMKPVQMDTDFITFLGLTGISFVSARAYIEGSHQAKCVVNQMSIQKAAASYANLFLNGNARGITLEQLEREDLLRPGLTCPDGGHYRLNTTGELDEAWVECPHEKHNRTFREQTGLKDPR